MAETVLLSKDFEFDQINKLYDECINYLKNVKNINDLSENHITSQNKGEILLLSDNITEDKITNVNDVVLKDKRYNEHTEDNDSCNNEILNMSENPGHTNDTQLITIDHDRDSEDPDYETIEPAKEIYEIKNLICPSESPKIDFIIENEFKSHENINTLMNGVKSERLKRLSLQLPKIIVTHSSTSLDMNKEIAVENKLKTTKNNKKKSVSMGKTPPPPLRNRVAYGEHPKRLVSKSGIENVALISNVPYEKMRLLNDTFHTLINLRWRWIVIGTVVVHFTIWLVFAIFWYITALAHYDFDPDPPKRTCVTGGKDFITIFLASVEAQTTIGFGDRTIDEECPESIFLFIMQLILGTGLSGVLTCVVYAKLTRPEKLSRDGVGFSRKAVISIRDGQLCLMMRVWDLNYDHIISSAFTAHLVTTYRTKEGEMLRYYARPLELHHKQFLLWPVTLVHEINEHSPLYAWKPEHFITNSYEITLSLKGASASMGTFTQSQTSYLPREIIWGHRFPPVVRYNTHKQKYVIDHKKLESIEAVDTPRCSAAELNSAKSQPSTPCSDTPCSFSNKMSTFHLERSSSFRKNNK